MSDDKQQTQTQEPDTSDQIPVTPDRDEVEIWKLKAQECEMNWKRALADYQNLERQTHEGQIRFAKLATQGFVEELLQPYEHLQLAAKHLQDKGLEMVINQFKQVFESQGLVEINPLGKPFDAGSMEVIETKGGKENEVLEVASVGFELNGIVVKHARVVVGKGK
ncbi:MAG TPA: nucleotide exchange factor GrpE [Patescibacteria group bacterium]|nr:nucleotide exchange factor GrpE [Patescibacteria group bacterium]